MKLTAFTPLTHCSIPQASKKKLAMKMQDAAPAVSGKTKGKRSKLSQKRKDDDGNGFGVHGAHTDGIHDVQTMNNPQSGGSYFNTSDPLGLDVNDAMNQGGGSPTLLSALKGSSLRAAYGSDFGSSHPFKEDNMGLLGDFKNAAARFSVNPMDGGQDGLAGDVGGLESDALWASFPSDVDSLFPSGGNFGEMYTGNGRGPSDNGNNSGPGVTNGARECTPEHGNGAGDMFRAGSNAGVGAGGNGNPPQSFIFDGYPSSMGQRGGGNVPGGSNGNNQAQHPSMSIDSSYDAYSAGHFKQQQRGGGGGGGMNGRMSVTGGNDRNNQGAGNNQYHGGNTQGVPRYYVNGNGQQQQHNGQPQNMGGYVSGTQMNSYGQQSEINGQGSMIGGGFQTNGNGYPGAGNGYPPMMRVPSSGSLGMMPPGSSGYGHHDARGGFDGNANGGNQKNDRKRSGSENNGGNTKNAKNASDGGKEMMDGGGMSRDGTWGTYTQNGGGYRVPNSGMVYHQRGHGGARGNATQIQGSMYSGSSSVSTTISGRDAGLQRNGNGQKNNAQMMMLPPYYMNQQGMAPNDGRLDIRGRGGRSDGPRGDDSGGLDELQAIIGKLDKATSHNIKESLYRLARSARVRGARGAGGEPGGGASAGQQQPGDKAQSMVDRCMANLLYHRYPDSPANEGVEGFTENVGNRGAHVEGNDGPNGGRVGAQQIASGMNVIRGRHGSA